MTDTQKGILAPLPPTARYLSFEIISAGALAAALRALCELADGEKTVVGLGQSLIAALGKEVSGLRTFGSRTGAGIDVPSTPEGLWCWLRGNDRGELLHRARAIERALRPSLKLSRVIDAFVYRASLDLTGYEDGTENPKEDAAVAAAVVSGRGPGLDGSSFVAVQQWVHDLDAFEAMSSQQQDDAVGRRKSTNEEIADAPPSAHVKRTAQESFDPTAFVLRRSMPWADHRRSGLVFVAFGKSFDAFEAQLNRMMGVEDGIHDALFKFTRPVSGAYFWCPPAKNARLDLSALGL